MLFALIWSLICGSFIGWLAGKLMNHPTSLIRNIVLFSVLIYELVGPALTRIALTRAGDITPRVTDAKNAPADDLDEED